MHEAGIFIGLGGLAIVIAFAIYKYSYARGEYDNFLKSLSEDDQMGIRSFHNYRQLARLHAHS